MRVRQLLYAARWGTARRSLVDSPAPQYRGRILIDHAFSGFRNKLRRLPISYRIAIGNAVIIAIGAVGGTLLTSHYASHAADLWLIPLFLFVGITVSVLTNFWIIRTAMRPLYELSRLVNHLQAGKTGIDAHFLTDTDPDISQLAAALNSLVKQLEERNRQLRALSKRAINAQEEERKRIALSLHDDTGQSLSMLIIYLEQLANRLPPTASELHTKLASAHQLATRTLAELRKIVYGLRPAILDDLGLVPAIRWYARSNLEEAGIRVEIQAPEETAPLPSQLNATIFRIAQEGINNILRHSQASEVQIMFSQDDEAVCLKIMDNGLGFDTVETSEQALSQQRLGLLGIQERVELIGGQLTVDSAPGKGTRLYVQVPLPPRREAPDE